MILTDRKKKFIIFLLIYRFMIRRLLLNLSLYLVLLVLIIATVLPMLPVASASQQYPPMGQGETVGSVTGRVITNASAGMSGITVYIVNAADTGIHYASSTTDGNGNYAFAGVNSTNGSAIFRIMATASGYDDTSSSAFSVSSGTTSTISVMMTRNYSLATATPVPVPRPGDITGYVRVENSSKGIDNVKVSLVKSDNRYVTISSTYTDNNGYYRFGGVSYLSSPGYQLRIQKDGYEELFTPSFLIVSDSTVARDVSITPNDQTDVLPTATAVPDTTGQIPTTGSSATATPQPQAGLLSIPGFEIIAVLAGLLIACALVKKK